MMEINTKGFDKTQWELFYSIKNTEFRRDKFKDEMEKLHPIYKPRTISAELGEYTRRLKRLRAGLIEYTYSIKNSQNNNLR